MTPQQSMASIEVAPGFRMELVATEPQVIDPVAVSTDENGKMYVVEMRDYSEKDKDFLGRIRLLTDEDGDGKYETSKVFLDKLSWPTAVICYDGGVFIGDPPDIIYAKDTDGDGVADVKQVIYTGFSRKNVQGMMNTLPVGTRSPHLWHVEHDRRDDQARCLGIARRRCEWKIEDREGRTMRSRSIFTTATLRSIRRRSICRR